MPASADSGTFAPSEATKDGEGHATISDPDRTAREAWQSKPERNLY